jgi:PilZ domain
MELGERHMIDLLAGQRVDEFALGDELEVTVPDHEPAMYVVVGLLFRRVRLSPLAVGVAARLAPRRVCALETAVMVATPSPRVINGETFDLSMSGVGLQLPEDLEPGTQGAIVFELQGRSVVASLVVKSVLSMHPPLMGCAFTNIAAADRDWIARFAMSAKAGHL